LTSTVGKLRYEVWDNPNLYKKGGGGYAEYQKKTAPKGRPMDQGSETSASWPFSDRGSMAYNPLIGRVAAAAGEQSPAHNYTIFTRGRQMKLNRTEKLLVAIIMTNLVGIADVVLRHFF